MDSRIVDTLRLTFTSLLVAGCDSRQVDDGGGIQACGDAGGTSQPGPPTLVSARVDSDKIVHLTFTEPIASVADVDPASFAISYTWSGGGYYGEGYTSYYDPMAALCSTTDICPEEYTDVIELGCAGNDPNTLMLRLDTFHPQICDNINTISEYNPDYESPLLAHFDANLGIVLDLDGEPLASLGAPWVSATEVYLDVDGEFPNYPIRVPIECD